MHHLSDKILYKELVLQPYDIERCISNIRATIVSPIHIVIITYTQQNKN